MKKLLLSVISLAFVNSVYAREACVSLSSDAMVKRYKDAGYKLKDEAICSGGRHNCYCTDDAAAMEKARWKDIIWSDRNMSRYINAGWTVIDTSKDGICGNAKMCYGAETDAQAQAGKWEKCERMRNKGSYVADPEKFETPWIFVDSATSKTPISGDGNYLYCTDDKNAKPLKRI